jgi:hypothetical protein
MNLSHFVKETEVHIDTVLKLGNSLYVCVELEI